MFTCGLKDPLRLIYFKWYQWPVNYDFVFSQNKKNLSHFLELSFCRVADDEKNEDIDVSSRQQVDSLDWSKAGSLWLTQRILYIPKQSISKCIFVCS